MHLIHIQSLLDKFYKVGYNEREECRMKKMLFVFNPRSGKEQIRGSLLDILDIFSRAGYELRVHVTPRAPEML